MKLKRFWLYYLSMIDHYHEHCSEAAPFQPQHPGRFTSWPWMRTPLRSKCTFSTIRTKRSMNSAGEIGEIGLAGVAALFTVCVSSCDFVDHIFRRGKSRSTRITRTHTNKTWLRNSHFLSSTESSFLL